jgi:hypothetical protein
MARERIECAGRNSPPASGGPRSCEGCTPSVAECQRIESCQSCLSQATEGDHEVGTLIAVEQAAISTAKPSVQAV